MRSQLNTNPFTSLRPPAPALAPAPLSGRPQPTAPASSAGPALERPRTVAHASTELPAQALENVLAAARAFYEQGLGNGEPTHWPCLDEYWTWLRKEITAITGYPNHGKSRLIQSVMLIKSALAGWRFLVYVPENEEDFYVEMAEMLVGRTANIKFSNSRMSLEQLTQAIEWLHAHFTVVTAPEGATPSQLLETFAHHHAGRAYDGILIDPWNQLVHSFQAREDIYLSDQFSLLKRFAIKHNMAVLVTAHPAGAVKDKNGKLIVPDAYSISGGKMWNNKFDNVLAVFRPAFPDPSVELWIHKIKKRGRVGKPGQLNLTYDLTQQRYFPEIGDTQHPLQTVSFNAPGTPRTAQDFPASTFEAPPPDPGPPPF